jgi:hypothetical protein
MPSNEDVQARLINLLDQAPDKLMVRRKLVKACGSSYRCRADEQISLLLSNGVFVLLGLGVKGSPKVVALNKQLTPDRCPLCHQPY